MAKKNDPQRFEDPDLSTPAHDAIMMWLQESAEGIVRSVFSTEQILQEANSAVEALQAQFPNFRQNKKDGFDAVMGASVPKIEMNTAWEVPIDFWGGVRYLDMVITAYFSVPEAIVPSEFRSGMKEGKHREWQEPVEPMILRPQQHVRTIACEVKPTIRSVGELIRQMRQYERYNRKDSRLAVVSPDDRFRNVIEQQGFLFILAPKPRTGPQVGLFQE